MLENMISILEEAMLGQRDLLTSYEQICSIYKLLHGEEKVKGGYIRRLARSLRGVIKEVEGSRDFASNLRMAILFNKKHLKLSKRFLPCIDKVSDEFLLIISDKGEYVEINAHKGSFFNIADGESIQEIYKIEKKRRLQPVLGDAYLYKMTGYKNYSCLSQKVIVNSTMNQLEGTTILACMPTGAGKSLAWQLPSFYQHHVGLTIVVVPTVALSIHQERSTTEIYIRCESDKRPRAFYSDMDAKEREKLFADLKEGIVPVLYISPEALINGKFHDFILELAKQGGVSRLVLDEAHMVYEWGNYFRTEFQFLSIFRKKLYVESNKKLKTVLLSATLDIEVTRLLKDLFSEEDNYIEIRGDALRNEIAHFVSESNSDEERIEYFFRDLPLIPKPFILYVKRPDDAIQLKNRFKNEGYNSVQVFTGKTSDTDRKDIIDRWNEDEIDIIIATSAFGMGVDKGDIRGVVHFYIPETISRFMQEFGRAGRDGFSAVSILSVVKETDFKYIKDMTNNRVLSVERILGRWRDIDNQYTERIDGSTFNVNMDLKPLHLLEEETGNYNATWNEYVLLFLYRQGWIDITDIKYNPTNRRHALTVQIKNFEVLENKGVMEAALIPIKQSAREIVDNQIKLIKDMLNKRRLCWSEYFIKQFPYTRFQCSGCPPCRNSNRPSFFSMPSLAIKEGETLLNKAQSNNVKGSLGIKLGFGNEIIFQTDRDIIDFTDINFIKDLKAWLLEGVNNLILPSEVNNYSDELSNILPAEDRYYSVWLTDEFLNNSINIVGGLLCVIYSKEQAEEIYYKTREYLEKDGTNMVIHVIPKSCYIESHMKELKDILECSCYRI